MKKCPFFSGLILFSLLSESAFALPEGAEVVSGRADMSYAGSKVLQIEASDKAIINYKKFNIGKGEKVRFIQPSKQATLLNRVTGEDPSKILGSLESNGKVFLVNSNGVYFGPESTVNVGSLIASTLSIKDQDFLSENYQFILGSRASIVNEGLIQAEGSIALMSDQIHNKGTIQAKAGSIFLGAGEVVTLDFTGDGLLSFAVDGVVKEAVVEQFGTLKAPDGVIFLTLATAKRALSEIVNHEGVQEGATFIEEGGKIFFVPESELVAKQLKVEGGDLSIQGKIEAETVEILGRDIQLTQSQIEASMPSQGGEVFIGGGFQGKGPLPYASKVWMDATSSIVANASEKGNGGVVVLWSKEATMFNGQIEAKGGPLGGEGGLVETSSLGQLGVQTGSVKTKGLKGRQGRWLLDPEIVYIASTLNINDAGGECNACKDCDLTGDDYVGDPCNPSFTYVVRPNCLDNGGDVLLQATKAIYVNDSILASEGSLEFKGCSSSSPINVYLNGNLFTTGNHPITFFNATPVIKPTEGQTTITIDTTNSGSDTGANITMSGVYASASATLVLKAGDGTISLTTSSTNSTKAITVDSAAKIQTAGILANGAITFPSGATVELTDSDVTINSTNHNITMPAPIQSSDSNVRNLTINAGTGAITLGTVGGNNTIGDISLTGKSLTDSSVIRSKGSVTIDTTNTLSSVPTIEASGVLTIKSNISLTATTKYSTTASTGTGANIILLGTIDGNKSLTLDAGSGGNISGGTNGTDPLKTIGGTTALAEFIITKANNVYTGAITAGFIKQTAGSSTSTFGGTLTATGSSGVNLAANSLILKTVSATSGGMTLSSNALTIASGSTINLHGAFSQVGTGEGNTAQIGASSIVTNNHSISFQMPVALTQAQTWNAGTGSISLGSSLTATSPITFTGGAVTFTGSVTSSGGGLSVTNSGTASIGSDITVHGSISFNTSSGITLLGSGTWDTSSVGGSIAAGTINGAFDLTLNAGSGSIGVGTIGGSTPLHSFTALGTNQLTSKSITVDTVDGSILIEPPVVIQSATTFTGSSITLEDTLTASSNLNLTFVGGTLSFSGALGTSSNGLGVVTMTGTSAAISSIYTKGSVISIAPPVSLNTSATLSTTAGSSLAGANITLSSTLDGTSSGGQDLMVDAGTGGVFTVGSIGGNTPLGSVEISSASNFNLPNISTDNGAITIHPSVNLMGARAVSSAAEEGSNGANIHFFSSIDGASRLTVDSGVLGSVTVDANIGSSTPLQSIQISSGNSVEVEEIHTSGALGIDISSGAASVMGGAVTTTGGGGVSLNNAGTIELDGDMTLTGSFSQIGAGDVLTQSSILQSTAVSFAGAVELLNNITWSSVFGNGTIEAHAVTSPGTPYSLSVDAGTGAVNLLGNIGTSTEGLGAFTATGNTIALQSIYTEGSIISITPTTSLITLSGDTVLDSTVDAPSGAAITLNAAVDATTAGVESLTVDAGSSVFTVGTIGGNIPLGFVDISAASNFPVPNITTAAGSIQIHPSIVLTSDRTLSTVGASSLEGADITLFSTVDASSMNVETLTLNGGTQGDIDLQGVVGDVTSLGALTFEDANNVKALSITAKALIQESGSGVSFFKDVLTIGSSGLDLVGTAFHFAEAVTSLGGATITNSGFLRLEAAADMVLGGDFLQEGTGRVFTGADLETSGSISWNGSIELTGNVLWDTATLLGGDVIANNKIDSLGFQSLTVDAGGAVSFLGTVGTSSTGIGPLSVTGTSASIQSIYTRRSPIVMTPPVTLNADAVISTTASNHPMGASITFGSTVDGFFDLTLRPGTAGTLSVGPIGGITPLHDILILGQQLFDFPNMTTKGGSIAIFPPLELVGNRTLKTTASSSGANISLLSTVEATAFLDKDLTLEAGIGNIALLGAIGSTNRIGTFTVASVKNAQINDLFATTIVQQAGSGITTFQGVLNTLGGGISLVGNAFVFKGAITVDAPTGFQMANEGVSLFESTADMVSGGPFSQTGTGLTQTAADILMNGSDASLTFTGPVSLRGEVNWNTVSGNGAVLLKKRLEGPGGIVIDSGSGTVTFRENVGEVERVGSIEITAPSTFLVNTTQVSTSTSQLYHSTLEIGKSTTFSNISGAIEIDGTFDGSAAGKAATFSMGGGALTFSSSVGSVHELLFLTAYNTGSFTAEAIRAGYLRVSGGIPTIRLNEAVTLSGSGGLFLDGGSISLGGTIQTDYFFIRSRGPIENITTSHPISVTGSAALGFDFIDAQGGLIGSLSSPIQINSSGSVLVGANPRADLAGTLKKGLIGYVPSNIPCIVTLNGAVIRDCNATPTPAVEFNTLPKYFFYLPGIYSSWDNLSNDEYFLEEAVYPAKSPRERTLFWKKPLRKSSNLRIKNNSNAKSY